MSARDELASIAKASGLLTPGESYTVADAILAAGYAKPRTITHWGVEFVHNGAFYKEYPTKEDAQRFADEMGEVGAKMRVVTREHVPAVYGEWEPAP